MRAQMYTKVSAELCKKESSCSMPRVGDSRDVYRSVTMTVKDSEEPGCLADTHGQGEPSAVLYI